MNYIRNAALGQSLHFLTDSLHSGQLNGQCGVLWTKRIQEGVAGTVRVNARTNPYAFTLTPSITFIFLSTGHMKVEGATIVDTGRKGLDHLTVYSTALKFLGCGTVSCQCP